MSTGALRLEHGPTSVVVDPTRCAVVSLRHAGREYVDPQRAGSLLRLAVPMAGHDAHATEVVDAAPLVELDENHVVLSYPALRTVYGDLAVTVVVDLTLGDDGLVCRLRLTSEDDRLIPQVTFPQLQGLTPRAEGAETALQLPGRRMLPFEELAMRPDDLSFLEVPLQEYIYYGCLDLTMKWLDYGDHDGGVTLYSRDTRYTSQGLLVERQDRDSERLNLRWAHYPELSTGETWDSGEFVVLAHEGDWYAGARAYRDFAEERYPYRAPQRIREALAIRSIWPALRNTRPTFRFTEMPDYALEAADDSLGIGEVVLWHWWLKNGLPMIVDERLGTEQELRDALAACRDGGVAVSMFVSHHILREGEETDPSWVHRNRAGQSIVWNWTYSDEYLPKFPVRFQATHSMVKASFLSSGWRETSLGEYRRIMDLGAESICFDVFYAWDEPDYSPTADGRPDEAGERLVEFGNAARDIIHGARPDGTFSGEWPSDIKVPVIDYTWDWRNGFDVADCAPFRYVFPQFRINANVGDHPRGPSVAFMEGALLNVMPGGLRTRKLADCPGLLDQLRRLTALRRRFLPFFTNGRFHHLEGLGVQGGEARLYAHNGELLVIACNPTPEAAVVQVVVDPAVLGLDASGMSATVVASDGSESAHGYSGRLAFDLPVPAEDVVLVHLAGPAGGS